MRKRSIEFSVGMFMLFGLLALLVLAIKVSGLAQWSNDPTYTVTAAFDNIGGLRERASVRIGGVIIGRVSKIYLDNKSFQAVVEMQINKKFNQIPDDSSTSIFTQGLLGANYVSVTPGFDSNMLKDGDRVQTTHSAMVLENLIGQFIYSMKGDKGSNDKTDKE